MDPLFHRDFGAEKKDGFPEHLKVIYRNSDPSELTGPGKTAAQISIIASDISAD